MNRPTSKITSKPQTAIPRVICEKLGLEPGDHIMYRQTTEGIVIEKMMPEDDPFVVFTEWSSAEDDAAYADL